MTTRVKKLRRSVNYKVIGGVAGGLGTYFDIDPIWFRIGFIALTLAGASGVLLYLLMWIFLKEEVIMIEQ